MPIEYVTSPVTGPDAFSDTSTAGLQAQAAILLSIGWQIRGDAAALNARAAAARSRKMMAPMPKDDQAEFPVPRVRPTGIRISVERTKARLSRRYGKRIVAPVSGEKEPVEAVEARADIAARLYRRATLQSAADLLEASLQHADELPRVAAAAAYFGLSSEPRRLIETLERGTHSADELVRDVAATALARIDPQHSRLFELSNGVQPATGGGPAHTSLLIHGTFAASNAWWQPGGDFHSYLLAEARPDLYNAADRFAWSGGYSDAARALGAADLRTWVNDHHANGLDLFAHSHGGSVAMLANQTGLDIGVLALLSCPVHIPKYLPDFSRVSKVVSIHVHFDLVILVDGGGQRYHHPQIDEHVVPVWFNHSATHDPQVWRENGLPALL